MGNRFNTGAFLAPKPAICKAPPTPLIPPVPYKPAVLTVRMHPYWGHPDAPIFESYSLPQISRSATPVYRHLKVFILNGFKFALESTIELVLPDNKFRIICSFSVEDPSDGLTYVNNYMTPAKWQPFNSGEIHPSKLPPPGWTASFYLWAWDLA